MARIDLRDCTIRLKDGLSGSDKINDGSISANDTTISIAAANAVGTITTNDAGVVTITAAATGTAWNGKSIVFALDANTPEATPTAAYANDTLTITVNSGANTTTANIVTAVNTTSEWTAVEANAGNFEPSVDDAVNATTACGVNAVAANALVTLASGSITITAEETGTAWNSKTIAFSLGSVLVNAPNAVYASNAITITVNSTANTTTANLTTALDGLANWSAVETAPGVFAPMDAGIVETTSGGDGGTFLGYIMSNNVEVELPVEALNEIYVYTDVDDQILSWVAKGV